MIYKFGIDLSEPKDKIKTVGLKNLNLIPKESNKLNSPKKSMLKKRLTKNNFLFSLNSPKFSKNSKFKNTSKFSDFSGSFSLSKDTKINMHQTYYQKFKKNFYPQELVSFSDKNIFTPKTRLSEFSKSKIDKNNVAKILKNSFSNDKVTNVSSILRSNNRTSTSYKTKEIKLFKNDDNNKYNNNNKNNNKNEYSYFEKNEKSIFENKLFKKKEKVRAKENILFKYRKVYPFIKNSEIQKIDESKELPVNIIKVNKKIHSILLNENTNIFKHSFNIIKNNKFSKKFINPWTYPESHNKKETIFIIKDINYGKDIIKTVEEMKKNEKENSKTLKEKNLIFKKFRKKLIEILLIYRNLEIPFSRIIKEYKLSYTIFNFNKTKYLNYFIKIQNFNLALKVLSSDGKIALDVDQFHMTSLHYAAKYNFYQIIPHLLGYGAYVDAKNSFGQTPLIFSLKRNFLESTLILFLYLANPFEIYKDSNFNNDIKMNFNTKTIFNKIKKIYIKVLSKNINFYREIKKEIYEYIVNECNSLIEVECLNLIKNLNLFDKLR